MEPFIWIAAGVFLLSLVTSTLKVFNNWERAVILRLGKFSRMGEPGLNVLIPFFEKAYRVDTRILTMDIARQEMMTRDNVPVTVDAIVLFRVVDPKAAVLNILDYDETTSLLAQTALRSTVGQAELDDLLSNRDHVNQALQRVIDEQTEPFGVKVGTVEIRDVFLPETMKRAMAAQAEAEREKRAKVINAEGEYQAAERLTQAAAVMSREPAALQLRYLQAMRDIASEKSTITILPVPIDLISPFIEMAKRINVSATSSETAASAPESPALAVRPDALLSFITPQVVETAVKGADNV